MREERKQKIILRVGIFLLRPIGVSSKIRPTRNNRQKIYKARSGWTLSSSWCLLSTWPPVVLVFLVAVTAKSPWADLFIRKINDFFHSSICSRSTQGTKGKMYCDPWLHNVCIWHPGLSDPCPCFCSRTTAVILSWILQSSSNSSSTTSQWWNCSPMQTRRATSCSG